MEHNYSREDEIIRLLKKHLTNMPLSVEEEQQLRQWVEKSSGNEALIDALNTSLNLPEENNQPPSQEQTEWLKTELSNYIHFDKGNIWNKFLEHRSAKSVSSSKSQEPVFQMESSRPKAKRIPGKYWAAAAVLLIVATGALFYFNAATPTADIVTTAGKVDFAPGKEGAILTLADGREIVLDSLGNGEIANEDGTSIILKNGELLYEGASLNQVSAFNTIRTPKGRQFQIVLPDGSRVWLNAASVLRYPTSFKGDTRNVEVSGEAYFEVSPVANMPFVVKINEETAITVLGTGFNINSYLDEDVISTTLISGSIRVDIKKEDLKTKKYVSKMVVLKPGQQTQIGNGLNDSSPSEFDIKVKENVNIDKVLAWKNGLFNFDGASLKEVMRQLERWYSIEVDYPKGVPDIYFEGKMGRDLSLTSVLKILEGAEVHFKIEGERLVVLP